MPEAVPLYMPVLEEPMDAPLLFRACKRYLSLDYGSVGEASKAVRK